MLNKLNFAELRYEQIEGEMNDPDIASNPTEFTKRIKEYNSYYIMPFRSIEVALFFILLKKEKNKINIHCNFCEKKFIFAVKMDKSIIVYYEFSQI